jgi:hypothetical protein
MPRPTKKAIKALDEMLAILKMEPSRESIHRVKGKCLLHRVFAPNGELTEDVYDHIRELGIFPPRVYSPNDGYASGFDSLEVLVEALTRYRNELAEEVE